VCVCGGGGATVTYLGYLPDVPRHACPHWYDAGSTYHQGSSRCYPVSSCTSSWLLLAQRQWLSCMPSLRMRIDSTQHSTQHSTTHSARHSICRSWWQCCCKHHALHWSPDPGHDCSGNCDPCRTSILLTTHKPLTTLIPPTHPHSLTTHIPYFPHNVHPPCNPSCPSSNAFIMMIKTSTSLASQRSRCRRLFAIVL
jgi:hypothetical protein